MATNVQPSSSTHEAVADKLAELADAEVESLELYTALLSRLSELPGVYGAVVWGCTGGSVHAFYQVGSALETIGADNQARLRHRGLLRKIGKTEQPQLVPAGSGDRQEESANPTLHVLAIAPVQQEERCVALLECLLAADSQPREQQACLRVLGEMAQIAASFESQPSLESLVPDASWWGRLDEFACSSHSTLQPQQAAYTIANDGRLVADCDRLSVLVKRGRKYRVMAVSGQGSINRRAASVRLLEELVTRALTADTRLVYPTQINDLPPQLEDIVEAYVDHSAVKEMAALALCDPGQEDAPDENRRPSERKIGAIVAERFSGERLSLDRVEAVARHAACSLRNIQEHRGVFLLPLWKGLGRGLKGVGLGSWPRLLIAGLLCAVAVIALILVQADFDLAAEGTLQPEVRRYVFAPLDGVVDELQVRHGDTVKSGAELARLRSSSLDLQIEEVSGEFQTTTKKLAALYTSRTTGAGGSLSRAQISQMAAEEEELKVWLESLERQQQLLLDEKEELTVSSPIDGDVVTWEVDRLLASRPVSQGQVLMTVAQLNGPWTVELHLADHRVGHFREAQRELGSDLEVSYILATDPGTELIGKVVQVAKSTTLDDRQRPGLLVTVEIDEEQIEHLRPGAKVAGKIRCGRRSIGYVWLHELLEFVQSRILFRIS